MKKLIYGFRNAFVGIIFCIKTCRNFRIHMVFAAYVLYFSRFYELDTATFAVLILTISLVLTLEALNCALEQVCNALTTKYNIMIKHAKDAAAGAVLIAAIFAAVIGVCVFYDPPTVIGIYNYFILVPIRAAVLIITLALSIIFIFYKDIFKSGKQRD